MTIPLNTAPDLHTIVASGATGDSASTSITVTTPAPIPTPFVAPTPNIAASGSGAPEALVVSHQTLVPGQATVMTGAGCAPGAPVIISIDGKEVDQINANRQGAFRASVIPLDQGVGQKTITATCGLKTFATTVSLVSTSHVSAPEGGAAVFGGFVLLGAVLVRGQFGGTTARRRRRQRGPSDLRDLG